MSFAQHLPKLARFGVSRITLAVSEKYARRKLKLKKDAPLAWHGIPLNCIGSERWRRNMRTYRAMPANETKRCIGCEQNTCTDHLVCDHCYQIAGGQL